MNLPAPQILVFDSGVGALSIIQALRDHLPTCSITYTSDNGFFPYGTKDEAVLVERVETVLRAAVVQVRPDIIVVACNTASTVALPKVRSHFQQPVVGVVPAIKPAAQLSRSKAIGVLATPATVARPYTRELIEQYASDCHIVPVGSAELVALAERKLAGDNPTSKQLQPILAPIFAPLGGVLVDTVVLACTHFPLLQHELAAAAPRAVTWVDSGEAIARRVSHLLKQNQLQTGGDATYRSLFTADKAELKQLAPQLQRFVPGPIELLSVDR